MGKRGGDDENLQPPPTTMILGEGILVIVKSRWRVSGEMRRGKESVDVGDLRL